MYEIDKKTNELRIISLRIDVDTLFKLDKAILKTNSNRSEIIRKAIEQYLENNKII